MKLTLRIQPPSGEAYTRKISCERLTIGRNPDCDLTFQEDAANTVSWEHAKIRCVGERVILSDVGSTNGTYLNQESISQETPLAVGDSFSLGRKGPRIEILDLQMAEKAPAADGRNVTQPLGYTSNADSEPSDADLIHAEMAPPSAAPYAEAIAPAEAPGNQYQDRAADSSRPVAASSSPTAGHQVSATRVMLIGMQKRHRLVWILLSGFFVSVVSMAFVVLFVFPGYLSSGYSESERGRLIARVEKSVVQLEVQTADGASLGSGFVYDRKGTIITNFHVVEDAQEIVVKFIDGHAAKVTGFLAAEPGKDLAAIRIEMFDDMPSPLPLASGRPSKGEDVMAFGSPKGFTGTVTEGIVSSTRSGNDVREIFRQMQGADAADNFSYDSDSRWVQISVFITNGNSGGPLVNSTGRVVGVNTWGLPDEANMNFASASINIVNLMKSASESVRPLSELPQR